VSAKLILSSMHILSVKLSKNSKPNHQYNNSFCCEQLKNVSIIKPHFYCNYCFWSFGKFLIGSTYQESHNEKYLI